ncbi:MAG: S24/S26 family peptidase [Candidatus Aenigmarchaeota archaeon]|nr:S24/S26 family peptidase [Candidatus Aenigmarchaeota archaeon]
MEPDFHEGDFVFIRKFFKLNAGDVVVTETGGKKLLKRILDIKNRTYFLQGDSQHDGKVFSVRKGAVIGKVFWHIKGN